LRFDVDDDTGAEEVLDADVGDELAALDEVHRRRHVGRAVHVHRELVALHAVPGVVHGLPDEHVGIARPHRHIVLEGLAQLVELQAARGLLDRCHGSLPPP